MSGPMTERLLIGLVIVAALGALVAANTHLVLSSLQSQPDCVPHLKTPGGNGQFRAAQSSC